MNEFDVTGMRCQRCVDTIETALIDAGIQGALVTLTPPQIRLTSLSITRGAVEKTISAVGDYKVVDHNRTSHVEHHDEVIDERLTPLVVVLLYICGGVLLHALVVDNFSLHSLMNNFMGGFFVLFSLFKLLNLPGFADAFASYDVLASRSRTYALAYPFMELSLGIAYLVEFEPALTNFTTLILMTISSVGVFRALKLKHVVQCACLGTVLKLPMTKVTLVENLTMGAMAGVMIIRHLWT